MNRKIKLNSNRHSNYLTIFDRERRDIENRMSQRFQCVRQHLNNGQHPNNGHVRIVTNIVLVRTGVRFNDFYSQTCNKRHELKIKC